MTERISEVIRGWLGWCPTARTMNTPLPSRDSPPVILQPSSPAGSNGGGGRGGRGIGIALGSIRLLFRNLRLLWFSLVSGILMIINLSFSLYIQMMAGADLFPGTGIVTGALPFQVAKGSLAWIGLVFTSTFVTSFFTYWVTAGLFVCISLILSGKAAYFIGGMARAGTRIWPLAGWAGIIACVGTVISYLAGGKIVNVPLYLLVTIASATFFILTMFVIPAIVLSNSDLLPAIRQSVKIFRKVWLEAVACFGLFFLITFVILFTSLVPMIALAFPSGNPAMAGTIILLYMLVMLCIMFIGSTLVGIATYGLYSWGTTGTLDTVFLKNREVADNI